VFIVGIARPQNADAAQVRCWDGGPSPPIPLSEAARPALLAQPASTRYGSNVTVMRCLAEDMAESK